MLHSCPGPWRSAAGPKPQVPQVPGPRSQAPCRSAVSDPCFTHAAGVVLLQLHFPCGRPAAGPSRSAQSPTRANMAHPNITFRHKPPNCHPQCYSLPSHPQEPTWPNPTLRSTQSPTRAKVARMQPIGARTSSIMRQHNPCEAGCTATKCCMRALCGFFLNRGGAAPWLHTWTP